MESHSIRANPTKEFFITMLTRDIPLDRAILDLIDNSVDAANSSNLLNNDGTNQNADVKIDINFTNEKFVIIDNCGGIPIEVAKNYAFRFGRPTDSPLTPNSVGQFGVGMKRTLFKLGKQFKVSSKHNGEEGFCVNVNVDDWKNDDQSNDWEFQYTFQDDIEENSTIIEVTDLYPEISQVLSEQGFDNALMRQISQSHFKSLRQGLKIYVNNQLVKPFPITFYDNDKISPLVMIKEIDGVEVKVIAGISERDLSKGGWYIVCNNRLVVASEQSTMTGWDTDDIRKYHPDAAYFRGIVEFNCTDSSKLPWTTTKTGVDINSLVYRKALILMKDAMRQILSFLNSRVKEAKYLEEGRINNAPLVSAIANSKPKEIRDSIRTRILNIPKANLAAEPSKETRIQYVVETEKFDKVAELLGITQKSEVGLKTFNYYYSYEVGNE